MSQNLIDDERTCDYCHERPARQTGVWLCAECSESAGKLLEQITALLPTLLLIVRGTEKSLELPGQKRPGKPVSQAPINIGAMVVLDELNGEWRDLPVAQLETDPHAGPLMHRLVTISAQAERMVHGERESRPSKDYIAYRLASIDPMTPQEAEEFFQNRLGMDPKVSPRVRQIYKWRTRGRLFPVDESWPARYRVLDIFNAWENRYKHHWTPDYDTHTPPPGIAYTTASV